MIKVLLNGCGGKMGKVVIESAKKFNAVEIVAGIDKFADKSIEFPVFKSIKDCNVSVDVIVDFSRPDALYSILDFSDKNKTPVVLCTTGYSDDQIAKINNFSKEHAIFRSANMSIGINVINNILKNISAFLYEDYDIEIIEKHHNQKVDAPSGTALLLGDTIKDAIKENTVYINGREGIHKREHNEIGVHAIRGGSIVGEHEIIFAGQGETIELKHTAISREVFAVGALKASLFMANKSKGLYNMNDVLNAK
ncbi:4-hydroxy-tetrahydrodipicolinate reductase [Clostridium pasteurianum DSM 525 = ATCC 6013]|uniref:4-hydroxy-tetrahydrodipicolinate reductase n=1 Tax=Clostridium pasteurianum DSM 525 = ATCC 6013 TaxID=1262449 RepID=A0A0H3J739_CLOPA|nr:4-hydroxy-tetrahydrodipicolinate reductase [Clostridium pasteurianum]AJA47733.1 4-hydroxy-tetrahydrodipicolinate reductase [Clostridium pasteurianum DSM 525 = ATCC 6013]AJA51721.1 4-hydroxy-tetrahydrodipicolinate reductase [Clostridium pasteurianum DSM 525 = ATCC 6013]AOZ75033.1 4-hydroxy-tetrahydrodipicolinate reductase [Clostridium pasteurianum DSM 525 = ATCC 6013]AOZ78828.1 4-hydroxy-tetrahydrodipicolinate reductase [Clostridium pasteurianum]ELP59635.1 dihydrodipicolinate reductase [Clos